MTEKTGTTAVVSRKEIDAMESAFLHALSAGIDQLQVAGKALVKLLDADPEALPRLVTDRGIPRGTLGTLLRIGRGQLLPEFAFRPAMARLPISEQRRIAEGTVEAVVMKNGKTETIRVDLRNSEPAMYEQLVASDHVRTLPEQVQFLNARERMAAPQQAATEGVPWRVCGGRIDILRAVKGLTRGDLLSMQRALEA